MVREGPVGREKLEQVKGKIEELRRMETALQRLVEACEARVPTGACPILEELDHEVLSDG